MESGTLTPVLTRSPFPSPCPEERMCSTPVYAPIQGNYVHRAGSGVQASPTHFLYTSCTPGKPAPSTPSRVPFTPGIVPYSPGIVQCTPIRPPNTQSRVQCSPGIVSCSPSRVSCTPSRVPSIPGRETGTPSTLPCTAGRVPCRPGRETGTPSRVTRTTGRVPCTPRSVPRTPSIVPCTPNRVACRPEREPGTPSRVARTPGREPRTPESVLRTPSIVPCTPNRVACTPGREPGTPGREPCAPGSVPRTPSIVPCTPNRVARTPNRVPGTPLCTPVPKRKFQPCIMSPLALKPAAHTGTTAAVVHDQFMSTPSVDVTISVGEDDKHAVREGLSPPYTTRKALQQGPVTASNVYLSQQLQCLSGKAANALHRTAMDNLHNLSISGISSVDNQNDLSLSRRSSMDNQHDLSISRKSCVGSLHELSASSILPTEVEVSDTSFVKLLHLKSQDKHKIINMHTRSTQEVEYRVKPLLLSFTLWGTFLSWIYFHWQYKLLCR